jgi:ribonuclease P protein component
VGGRTETSRPQTLPPAARVRKRREFLEIQRVGRRVPTRHFLVVHLPRGDDACARLGITVTRKIGTAVVRNRVKRAVREAFRRVRSSFEGGIDLVVIARDGAGRLAPGAIGAELTTAWTAFARAGTEPERIATDPQHARPDPERASAEEAARWPAR